MDEGEALARPVLDWRTDAQRLISTQGAVQVKRLFGRSGANHLEAYLWKDLFTSLVDAHWRRTLLLGAFLYILSWTSFGLLYWIVMNNAGGTENDSCRQFGSYAEAFLLSIDAQTTIGFGNYAVNSECTLAVYILVLQCLVAIILDAAYTGLIFAKISRPQYRSSTVIFSRHACISEAGGHSYLMIRVADQRKNQVGVTLPLLQSCSNLRPPTARRGPRPPAPVLHRPSQQRHVIQRYIPPSFFREAPRVGRGRRHPPPSQARPHGGRVGRAP
jgi:hypothetical protein